MAEDSDQEKVKNPQPVSWRRRVKGQIPRSRELTSMLMLGAGLTILWMSGESMARQLSAMVAQGLHFDHSMVSNDKQMLRQIGMLLRQTLLAMLPILPD